MKTAAVIEKMIKFSERNIKDINHFMKVWSFARLIGILEALETEEQEVLEVAAAVHDIACEFCRKKYGHCSGKVQEEEGPALTEEFLEEFNFNKEFVERVCWLVGHHHTYKDVEGKVYQILLEADFLVNADEGSAAGEEIRAMHDNVFRTQSGKQLLKDMYPEAWQ